MFWYTGLPLVMAAVAVVMDLRTAQVDNGWILVCMGTGLSARILKDGAAGIADYLAGFVLPILLLGWLFAFRMLGPGDIKLLAVLGGMLGRTASLQCVFCSMLLGAALSAALLLADGNAMQRFAYLWEYLCAYAATRERRPYYQRGMAAPENFHFTVPVFLSVLLYTGGVY